MLEAAIGFNVYSLSIPISLTLLIFIFSTSFNKNFVVYILILCLSAISGIILFNETPDGFYQIFYLFILQPIIVYIACYFNEKEQLYIDFLSKLTIISFLGSVYFYLSALISLPTLNGVFDLEFTLIGGDGVVVRNTSIFTNSLVASGVGLIHACASAFMFKRTRKSIYILLLIAALFIIFTTLSRRGFLPAFIICAYIFNDLSFRIKAWTLSILLSVLLIFNFYYGNFLLILFERIMSSIDFSGADTSNISRLNLIKAGILVALLSPLGSGFGTLSSIGKSRATIDESIGFKTVTESFYISYIGEVGWLYCIPIFFILFRAVKNISRDYRIFFIYPFMIESIMGLGLLNPMISFFFTLCIFSSIKNRMNYKIAKDIY